MLKKLFAYRTSQASSIQEALIDGSAVFIGEFEDSDPIIPVLTKVGNDIADSVCMDEEIDWAWLPLRLKISGSHGHLIIDSVTGEVLSCHVDPDDSDEYYSDIERFHMDRFWQLQRDLEIDWSDRDDFDICVFGYWNKESSTGHARNLYDEPAPDYTATGFMALYWTGICADPIEAMDKIEEI